MKKQQMCSKEMIPTTASGEKVVEKKSKKASL
jgi:hypothetical protein